MSDALIIFLAAQFILFILALVRMYTEQQSKNREFELEIRSLKMHEDEMSKKMDHLSNEISRKFDFVSKDIIEIKLSLKDKQNK